ncbi:MAG: RagB/SusD family nutrient uptake outer membrane protein [Candidatus Cryptobacteroides sp.]
MKKISKYMAAVAVAVTAVSCSDFLDMTPTDSVSDKVIWENTENAEMAVNYLYSYTYDVLMNQCVAGQTESLTDLMKYGSYNYNSLCFIPSEIAYGDETTLTASYVDTYLGFWSSTYWAVRLCNEALYNLDNYGKMSSEDKIRLEGEIRFVRAYLYFDLVKRYKEVILYDRDLASITKDKALSSEKDCWDFILDDLKYAADKLPAKANAGGRIDKGMAYAFITRAMLYAANGMEASGQDPKPYYQAVIYAAGEVTALGYDLTDNYADSYSTVGNSEVILQYLFSRADDVTHSFDYYYTPGGDYSIFGQKGGGYGTPTQEMVESYELATGGSPDWSEWHGETTSTPPYELLEPRFQATVLYNGASWKGREIESYVGGSDGYCEWNVDPEPNGRTTTGYYLRKIVDENHDVIKYSNGTQPLSIIRYAEVLLNQAEALFKTGDEVNAEKLVNRIRARVGLPAVAVEGNALWAALRQERKVELSYEGLWYWDLRRWGVAHKAYPEGLTGYQVHGLKITKDDATGEFTYTYVAVDDKNRNFPQKLYRFPLPSSELRSNSLVDQFPEWK